MSNFIYSDGVCMAIGDSNLESIRIMPQLIFVREDNGEEVNYCACYTPSPCEGGVRLVTKIVWDLCKDYNKLARFDTKEEAQTELKRIVNELAKNNVVVEVKRKEKDKEKE